MSKLDIFNIKLHIVFGQFRLVLAIISLLEQHNIQLLSLHLEAGVIVFLSDVHLTRLNSGKIPISIVEQLT